MSDKRIRLLERRWQTTEGLVAEADLLRERVKVGDLERDHLELAAYVGHPAADMAVEYRVKHAEGATLMDWGLGFALWGSEPIRRAAVALSRAVLAQASHGIPPHVRAACEDCIARTEDYLLDPDTKPALMSARRELGRSGQNRSAGDPWVEAWAVVDLAMAGDLQTACLFAVPLLGEDEVRGCVRDELSGWALGRCDPVRERVEERLSA